MRLSASGSGQMSTRRQGPSGPLGEGRACIESSSIVPCGMVGRSGRHSNLLYTAVTQPLRHIYQRLVRVYHCCGRHHLWSRQGPIPELPPDLMWVRRMGPRHDATRLGGVSHPQISAHSAIDPVHKIFSRPITAVIMSISALLQRSSCGFRPVCLFSYQPEVSFWYVQQSNSSPLEHPVEALL